MSKVALIVHVYYEDVWLKIRNHIIENALFNYFDIYITSTKECKSWLEESLKNLKCVQSISYFENKGKDIYPFLKIVQEVVKKHKYFCKIHTKKKEVSDIAWNASSTSLFLKSHAIERIRRNFESGFDIGLIGFVNHYENIADKMFENKEMMVSILNETYGYQKKDFNQNHFFAGSVFWGRSEIVADFAKRFFQTNLDFQSIDEIDGMLEHALERVLGILPEIYGCKTLLMVNSNIFIEKE